MKPQLILSLLTGVARATVQGLDISRAQQSLNFTEAYNMGLHFAYIKTTEGATYTDPKYSSHYQGAADAGFLRGAYHTARPSQSSGTAQAKFFLSHGGGWSNDGFSLPGVVHLEDDCDGMKVGWTVGWIKEFVDEYQAATGKYVIIYTTNTWWVECTGNSAAFKDKHPLMLANWGLAPGSMPGNWLWYTFWQYKGSSAWGGNSDVFNGDAEALKNLATR